MDRQTDKFLALYIYIDVSLNVCVCKSHYGGVRVQRIFSLYNLSGQRVLIGLHMIKFSGLCVFIASELLNGCWFKG